MAGDGEGVLWRREIERSRKEAETGGAGGVRIVVILATESKTVIFVRLFHQDLPAKGRAKPSWAVSTFHLDF